MYIFNITLTDTDIYYPLSSYYTYYIEVVDKEDENESAVLAYTEDTIGTMEITVEDGEIFGDLFIRHGQTYTESMDTIEFKVIEVTHTGEVILECSHDLDSEISVDEINNEWNHYRELTKVAKYERNIVVLMRPW